MLDLRRLLRGVRYAGWGLRSALLLMWYRALFKDFTVGRQVRIGRAVLINVVKGGRLHLGDQVVVEANVKLVALGELTIGCRGFVGQGTVIASHERVSIGSDALIAEFVTIRDQDHETSEATVPYNQQGLATAPIEIGENVWLGSKVSVVRGVRIGAGCVVGANSVVSRDLPEAAVCVGAPARPIRAIGATNADKRGS